VGIDRRAQDFSDPYDGDLAMTSTPTAPTPPPDWQTPVGDLACPLCAYNLRGLTEPRCPECGFAFTWADLIDAKRDRHPYLFEHARRPWSPPARALRLTAWRAGLRPWRFWRDVSPTNPVRLRRLVLYWALTSLPLLLLTVVAAAAAYVGEARDYAANRRVFWGQTYIDAWAPPPWTAASVRAAWRYRIEAEQGPVLAVATTAAAWPWLTAAGLMVFQRSMRRARVTAAHLARVAVYAGNVGLLAVVFAVAVFGPDPFAAPLVGNHGLLPQAWREVAPLWLGDHGLSNTGPWAAAFDSDSPLGRWGVLAAAAAVLPFAALAAARLAVAARRYLQFNRPLWTAVATQAIVVLIVVVVMLQLTRWF
jgi:hypothetical protein